MKKIIPYLIRPVTFLFEFQGTAIQVGRWIYAFGLVSGLSLILLKILGWLPLWWIVIPPLVILCLIIMVAGAFVEGVSNGAVTEEERTSWKKGKPQWWE